MQSISDDSTDNDLAHLSGKRRGWSLLMFDREKDLPPSRLNRCDFTISARHLIDHIGVGIRDVSVS